MAPISLLEIPDLPMETIMKKLDYTTIQSLRKTCWSLRNFIDEKKTGEECLNRIELIQKFDKIHLILRSSVDWELYPKGPAIFLTFETVVNGGLKIYWQRSDGIREKIVENMDYMDGSLKDFEIALNNCKSEFDTIHVSTTNDNKFLEKISKILNSRKPIPTKHLEITTHCQAQAQNILKYIDSKCLKSIYITLAQNNIVTKEEADLEGAAHFALLCIPLEIIDVATLRALKKLFLESGDDKKYFIRHGGDLKKEIFIEAFGPAVESDTWYFKGFSEKVLQIYFDFHFFNLCFVEKAGVPNGAVIVD
ncbi:hypothetical protein GCK72_021374 [Caenorhabditis remanei]|uniref:F-box domain-containing protein n=1 Tax=Caenorhabditis remanei TaxID=31234 RepID=A0A6A5GHZ2_CAERE|nr:hypothetical protein GCK72_021374 [Caenorhabditis remanei]KAF1754810.1 hypothetical protein GCK72_021374 [Caenorhabditis remanei]